MGVWKAGGMQLNFGGALNFQVWSLDCVETSLELCRTSGISCTLKKTVRTLEMP